MHITSLHRWPTTTRAAIDLQKRLAGRIRVEPLTGPVRTIAGLDAAFSRDGRQVIAGVVLFDLESGGVLEQHVLRRPCRFPYVPGLLSFREAPAVLAAAARLRRKPDAFMCDGQGRAHPRRLGLASHVGLWLDRPTIGCAKSRLCGEHDEPGPLRGSSAPLMHAGEVVGRVLRTRDGVKPLYISPGNRIDLDDACQLVLASALRYRMPEPTRLADRLVAQTRRES